MTPRRLVSWAGLAVLVATAVWWLVPDDSDDAPTRVALDGRPSAVLHAGGALWVAEDAAASVHRIDPATGDDLGSVALAPASPPIALVEAGGGVWAIGARGVLTKLGVESGAVVATVDVGGAPVDAVAAGDRLWVADIEHGVVHVLDPEAGEVVADPVPVPAGAVRLAAAGGRVWVSGLEDQVTPIVVATMAAGAPVTVGVAPIGMGAGSDVLWVANSEDDSVSRIDLVSGQVVGEPVRVGDAPIAVEVDGTDVLVLNQDAATVVRLDAATGEPIGDPVELALRPRAMDLAGADLWVVGVEPSLAVRA